MCDHHYEDGYGPNQDVLRCIICSRKVTMDTASDYDRLCMVRNGITDLVSGKKRSPTDNRKTFLSAIAGLMIAILVVWFLFSLYKVLR